MSDAITCAIAWADLGRFLLFLALGFAAGHFAYNALRDLINYWRDR